MILRKLGKLNFSSSLFMLIAGVTFFSSALYIHHNYKRPEINISKQDSAVNINTLFLKFFSLGNKRLLGDLLWIQTLLESDLEVYKGDTGNSWMFFRFQSIANLDPLFYENYLYGGQYLSIIKDDLEGAEVIMGMGLKHYPEDYSLNFNQGFNYYFEMQKVPEGLVHFEKIKDHPDAPTYLQSLVIKLRHEVKPDPQVTITFLREAYDKTLDNALKRKLAADIYSLKATVDLECLNNNLGNCERTDAEGGLYVFDGEKFTTQKPFKPYKIHRQPK